MSAVLVIAIPGAVLCAAVLSLIPLGLRAGDRHDEARLDEVAPETFPRGVRVTIDNPGHVPVLAGVSLRRPRLRLRLEGGSYVSIRSGRVTPDVLATGHVAVGVIPAGDRETLWVPADPGLGRWGELVVIVGQSQRLRAIHRLVMLPPHHVPPAPAVAADLGALPRDGRVPTS
jgi:hypothetical protein